LRLADSSGAGMDAYDLAANLTAVYLPVSIPFSSLEYEVLH
jgi:hypothetical protein